MSKSVRLKATKFAEMHAFPQGDGNPPHIFTIDRMKMTTHGDLFRSLIVQLAPAAVPLVSKGEIAAYDVVAFARDLTHIAYQMAATDKMLAMTVPPENAVNKMLKGDDDV